MAIETVTRCDECNELVIKDKNGKGGWTIQESICDCQDTQGTKTAKGSVLIRRDIHEYNVMCLTYHICSPACLLKFIHKSGIFV